FSRVADAFKDLAEDQGKALETHIEPSMFTWGDCELLAEMVANVLDNAVRHMPTGARIELSLASDCSEIVGSVRDNGLGKRSTTESSSDSIASNAVPRSTGRDSVWPSSPRSSDYTRFSSASKTVRQASA